MMRGTVKVVGLLLTLFLAALAFGQAEAGSITGTVRDSSGAVVPDAVIKARSLSTGAERSTKTSALGQYNIPGLTPGSYDLTITRSGFASFKGHVEVTVGSTSTLDASLTIGNESTTVEVVAGGAAEVNTQTQEISQLIDTQQIAHLPSLTRNPYDFVAISGNVSNGDTTSNGATMSNGGGGQELQARGVGYAINGQRETGTEILLDGVENTSIFAVNVGTNIPVDGVQEYSVVTNNFSAEYGRAAGGVVNVTTKPGTNDWHGTAWEFNRLSAYTANTYNNVANDLPKGAYTRNQFGFQLGGPIVRNKLFISESTEFTRVRSNSVQTAEIFDPTFIFGNPATGYPGLPANAQAYFESFGTTTVPNAGVASTWGQWVAASGCFFGAGAGGACVNPLLDGKTVIPNAQPVMDTVNYTAPFNAGGGPPGNIYTLVGRLDYNLSDQTQMFFRAARERDNLFPGTTFFSAYPQYDVGSLDQNESYLLSLNRSFNSYLLSNSKISFARYNDVTSQNPALTFVPNVEFYAPNDPVTSAVVNMPGLENASIPGQGGVPNGGPQNTIQLEQDVSWNKGKHNMRFGGQFTYIQLNFAYGAYVQAVEQLGGNTTQSMEDLINSGGAAGSQLGGTDGFDARVGPNALPCPLNQWGEFIGTTAAGGNACPASSLVTPPLSTPSFARSYRYNDWAIYAQDSFRMKPRLTLNYGLRLEHYGVQHNNDQSLDSNFYAGSGSTLFQQVANGQVFLTQKSPAGQFWNPSWGTLAPRVGFAYDLFGDGKSSLRGGFGISYERNFGNVTFNASFNPPASAVLATTCPPATASCNALVTNNDLGPLGLASTPSSPLPPVELRYVDANIRTAQTQFWSLALQRQVGRSTMLELSYNGAHGVHLYDLNNVNNVGMAQAFMGAPLVTTPDPVTGAVCPYANLATGAAECLTRPNQQYSNINERGSGGTSAYEGLNLKFQTQNLHNTGLALVANYTWSHSLDDASSTFSDSIQGGSGPGYGSLGYTSVVDPKLDWGSSDYDVRQRLVISPIWTTPWFKSQRGLGDVLGGWTLTGIFTGRTGVPFSMFDLSNEEFDYTLPRLTPATAITNFHVSSNPQRIPTPGNNNVFGLYTMPLPASFAPLDPALGISDYGPFPADMTGRNAFRGPGAWNFDSAVEKNFKITERYSLTFRAEGFNIFNHHNMYTQTTSLLYSGPTTTPFFVEGFKGGLNNFATGGNNDERRFGQFSLRFNF
jgi:Carboxypeptidase regulatory-like domain/TonB dependent receptor